MSIIENYLQQNRFKNIATNYYYENPKISNPEEYQFSNDDFKKFTKFLKQDSTFVTDQERLFKEAFLTSKDDVIAKEYNKIKEKLFEYKIAKITKNQDIITKLLKDEILTKYYYKNGVYENHLKNDESIFEAVKLLNNQNKYEQILSAK